ncbi:Fe-S cluster biogenesis protein NfuA, 4Fe-4S-binding domain [Hyphomicrobiales bacterium]|nr:Fe-S cluster biogenesis protein NfuA, 4Fe-4S-binding domain [Hyphomicrobiales bacterium]CAH1698197.1 Fe-S cluster biogenesis protein NfuA, 4Fe-4S-binding domain [Hyphomicrobiales bacterium]CAI0347840.1 NFU1 iron-sulfur cluster scaffold homolog, mitochondrial [Hyphomicrobiales bacterium]
MFIQTEATPNPATLKFLPGRIVMGSGTLDMRDVADAGRSPLAQRLFGVSGVSGVFLGSDFITVTKSDGEWPHLKPAILGAIMEHFMSGAPVLAEDSAADLDEEGEFFAPEDAETVETIKDLLETRIRPAVAGDGGDITFRGYRDGTVYLVMKGACSGCPSSTATLKHGIQNLLRHFLPEVREVEAV